MNNIKNNPKSALALITSMIIFGSIGVLRRYIPLSSAFLALTRGIIGGVFILAFVFLIKGGFKEKIPFKRAILLALTGALIGFNWILLFEAFNHTTVAAATLCYYMEPTIVIFLSPVFFKEKLTAKRIICALTAVFGMVLVSGVLDGVGKNKSFKGVLFGLGAAAVYSAVVILNKKITVADAYQKTAVQLLSAGVIMVPYILLTGGFSTKDLNATTLVLLLILGIIHTGAAYVLYFGSMDGLKAQSIALYSYIDPVSALFFSAILLKEGLSPMTAVGAVMIIGSAIICEVKAA